MTMINEMFKVAVKNKFRFNFKGIINTEDLFDLSLESLDLIFKTLNSQLKQTKEESLLEVKTLQDQELETKIAIVKFIFQEKMEEEKSRLDAKLNKEKRQRLMAALANKQDKDLLNKTSEEIQQMIDELEG